MKRQDFFIGWQEEMPDRHRRVIRKFLLTVFLVIPLLAFSLVYFAKPFNDHAFEFGQIRQFEGVYFEKPFPVFLPDGAQALSGVDDHILLVGYGKFGATGIMRELENVHGSLSGRKLTMQGTLIHGDGRALLELTRGNQSIVEMHPDSPQQFVVADTTSVTLIGEVIDPKCWFGAMKPGEGKVHKSCAIRCISGGIPPVLRVTGSAGYHYYLIQGRYGEAMNREILPYVAENVRIQGVAYAAHGWNILQARPDDIVLVDGR